MDEQATVRVLDADVWQQRRRRLEQLGGPCREVPRSGVLRPCHELAGERVCSVVGCQPSRSASRTPTALTKYLEQKDALHAGRKPRETTERVTVKDVANVFLDHKQALLDAGKLSPRTWGEYKEAAKLVVKHLGKPWSLSTASGPADKGACAAADSPAYGRMEG
jgi:hypothetical protein